MRTYAAVLHSEIVSSGMRGSWFRAVSGRKSRHALDGRLLPRNAALQYFMYNPISAFLGNGERTFLNSTTEVESKRGGSAMCGIGVTRIRSVNGILPSAMCSFLSQNAANLCSMSEHELGSELFGSVVSPHLDDSIGEVEELRVAADCSDCDEPKPKAKEITRESIDFTKIPIEKLPTVLIMGRPNVGKSALFNRLIRRREALVYNTPNDHVTRDIRDGIAKLGDLRFRVLDSAGLEAEASSGSVLGRTAAMTGYVLAKAHVALFLIDARDGVQPSDLDVGKWLRKHAPGMKTIVVMNKAELLDNISGSLPAAAGEAYTLGFGDPIALSAETGFGLAELSEALRPSLEDYVLQNIKVGNCWEAKCREVYTAECYIARK